MLVNIIIEPIGIKQIGMAAPGERGQCGGIVSRKVILRHLGMQTLIDIPKIFIGQSIAVVFRVPSDKELTAALICYNGNAGGPGGGQNNQILMFLNILPAGPPYGGNGESENGHQIPA